MSKNFPEPNPALVEWFRSQGVDPDQVHANGYETGPAPAGRFLVRWYETPKGAGSAEKGLTRRELIVDEEPPPLYVWPPSPEGQALRQILTAWTDPGPVPAYHRAWQDRLRREWPTLATALDAADRPSQKP